MTMREDGWLVFMREDGTVLFQVKPPPEGFTMADVEQFRQHVMRLIAAGGPN
jgi:hypothetical protein